LPAALWGAVTLLGQLQDFSKLEKHQRKLGTRDTDATGYGTCEKSTVGLEDIFRMCNVVFLPSPSHIKASCTELKTSSRRVSCGGWGSHDMVYREGIRHRIGRGISLFHTLIG
jgi:hypothetical protein